MTRKLYTVRQFCIEQKVSKSFAYKEIATGRLKAVKCHVMTFIEADAVLNWERQRKKSNQSIKGFSLVDWIIRRSNLSSAATVK